MKLVGVNPSEPISTLVVSLETFLRKEGGAKTDNCLEIAKGLFRKMPSYITQESDLRTLKDIVIKAEELLSTLKVGKTGPVTTSFKIESLNLSTGFLVALTDRPFIIDTIREYFKEKNIQLQCLTHPIFNIEEKGNISLSFFQIDGLEDNLISLILKDLKELLSSLILATADFPEIINKLNQSIEGVTNSTDPIKEEIKLFLTWLRDGGFIFLGHNFVDKKSDSGLGLLISSELKKSPALEKEIEQNVAFIKSDSRSLFFSKSLTRSLIHRADYLDIISVKTSDNTIHNFIGLFTSKTRNQEASNIPILRKKLADVLIEEGLIPNSHDYKELISLADTLPKSDFLQYTKDQARSYFNEVTNAQIQGSLKLIHIVDRLERFHYFTTVLPAERFSKSTIQTIEDLLRSSFSSAPEHLETHAVLGDHPLVLVRTMVPFQTTSTLSIPLEELESAITEKTTSWDEQLQIKLIEEFEETRAAELYSFYTSALPKSYKSSHNSEQAIKDILVLEKLTPECSLDLSLESFNSLDSQNVYLFRIFKRGEGLTLSNIVPYLENCGFSVLSETIATVAKTGTVWATIYDLHLSPKNSTTISEKDSDSVILPALKMILKKEASNDLLNYLLIRPNIPLAKISILRGYVRYLSQVKLTSSPRHAMEALVENPEVASLLIEYFEAKFNPKGAKDSIPSHERLNTLSTLLQRLQRSLKKVSNISHDRILSSLLQVMDATLRTNYYVHELTPYISFKIDSSRINNIPKPIPFREIFVSAPGFQGVHLRGGKVARGGLRWSSRKDDFRTEVLGLMKTQMVKNSIIIPVGAKGGFILHEEPTDRKELAEKVEATYRKFIHALLDITDNRIENQIKSPQNCICYDEHDPYFVVAADRGTATFSDIANHIATDDYSFWLGDAFASGGSVGYDHKKLGITAKGAWECAKRHFTELGLDTDTQEFTVVGVGDMSGDVFGNGLIISSNAKLLAAFDHRHIFLDPNPDSKISFKERVRLFNLPTSSWDDYNKSLLSQGGMVVSRLEKEVTLSEEIQKSLGTEIKNCSTNELIQLILKAPVDLLWNGGIGTYVKSSEEDHSKASDRTNDEVRVDAKDLRVRIVAEGGNLGFTQLGRIEYSRIGGRINTDAVDNSGGVDMSDLEVNFKLLFREAMAKKEITYEQRNVVLKSCEEEACQKVLSRNQSQSLVLSLAIKRSRINLNFYKTLIELFEKQGRFSRELEALPSNETFEKRKLAKAGLTRPELAVLIAHTKMWVTELLLDSKLPEEESLKNFLISYFPKTAAEKYLNLILKHPLKREIVATQIANSLIERMGSTFLLRLASQSASSNVEVLTSYLVSDLIFESQAIVDELKILDTIGSSKIYLSSLLRVQATLETMSRWFLEDEFKNISMSELIAEYKSEFANLIKSTDSILSPAENNRFEESVRDLLLHGVSKDVAKKLAASYYSPVYLDIIRASKSTKMKAIDIAKLYSALASDFGIGHLIDFANSSHLEDHWDSLAMNTLAVKIRTSVAQICENVIKEEKSSSLSCLETYLSKRSEAVSKYQEIMQEFKSKNLNISSLFLLANLLDRLGK